MPFSSPSSTRNYPLTDAFSPPAATLPKSKYDKVIVTTFNADSEDNLKIILACLKPNGKVVFLDHSTADGAESDAVEKLKLTGFQNPTQTAANGGYRSI